MTADWMDTVVMYKYSMSFRESWWAYIEKRIAVAEKLRVSGFYWDPRYSEPIERLAAEFEVVTGRGEFSRIMNEFLDLAEFPCRKSHRARNTNCAG